MLKGLKKYRYLFALLALFAVSFGYINISKNQLSNPVVQIEEVEFEEASLEGLADFGCEFFTLLFAIVAVANFNTPIIVLIKRLNFEFISHLAQSIQSVGHFLRFHQIKLGF